MLQRLARTCYRRRWTVLGGWVVLLVGLFALNTAYGGKFLDEFDLPGSESQQAYDMLDEHGFEARTGFSGQVVFTADGLAASGEFTLLQSDFGIEPYSTLFGAIAVQDRVTVRFRIVARAESA